MTEDRHVFISHVEEDAPLALALSERLEKKGYSTWYYERDTLPGFSYLEQTGKAVERCKVFLLIISKDSLGSHQVDLELERAHEESKTIIPVRYHVSHPEFQNRRPLWRQIIGTRTSIEVDMGNVDLASDRIGEALKLMDIPANAPLPVSPTPAPDLSLPKFCRQCGQPYQQSATICGKCGGSRKPIESARHVVKEHLGLVEYDEGYVVDPSSKLIWQRDGDDVFCDYGDSVVRCRNIRLGGFSDWRLPTKEELTHLARYGYADLQRVFPTIQRRNYWALTSPAEVPFAQNAQDDVGLTVDLDPSKSSFGDVVTFFKRSKYCVKAVRRYR